jgi:chemotaxis signal transduction protein
MTDEMLVCCGVGDDEYAFRATDVRQVVRAERMRDASAPDGRIGALEVAGGAVPVFSLGRALGRPAARPTPGSGGHIVISGSEQEPIGWLVDRVYRMRIEEATAIAPLPSIVGSRALRWFTALVRTADTSRLLMAPRSAAARTLPARVTASVRPSARSGAGTAAPVLIFATPALPRAGVSRFALSCRRIVGVAQELSITTVPGSARHVAGLAWWRDTVVPVIDFRGRDSSDGDARRRCLIACGSERHGAAYVGLPVDADVAMHQPSAEDGAASDVPCPPFAAGVFAVAGQPVALLDLDALLDGDLADDNVA